MHAYMHRCKHTSGVCEHGHMYYRKCMQRHAIVGMCTGISACHANRTIASLHFSPEKSLLFSVCTKWLTTRSVLNVWNLEVVGSESDSVYNPSLKRCILKCVLLCVFVCLFVCPLNCCLELTDEMISNF